MDDGVTARLLLVSHCLLNPYSQVKGRRTPKETARFAVSAALQAGVGLVQLPCPEFTVEGPNRWAKSYEQFDTVFFRNHCAGLVDPVLEQLREYIADGTKIVGVIGVEGSPSCGAYQVGTAEAWGGCFDPTPEGAPWKPPAAAKQVGRGVFLATLSQALEDEGWEIPVIAVPKDSADPETLATFRGAVGLMLSAQGLDVSEGEGESLPADSADPFESGDLKDWA